ncbi:hypothetical protein, partial [Nocardiopsis lucentensis]
DHGNAEQMLRTVGDAQEEVPYGGHTRNPVHCVLVPAGARRGAALSTASPAAITSVAPTVLRLLGLPVPASMTAPSLLRESEPAPAGPSLTGATKEGHR